MAISKYNFYKITSLDGSKDNYEIIYSKNHVSKYIYNIKHSKKPSKLKDLLCSDNYEIELIKTEVCSRDNAKIKLYELKTKRIKDDNDISKETRVNDILHATNNIQLIELDEKQKQISLAYGLDQERTIFHLLKYELGLNIKQSYYEMSVFDFYLPDYKMLIELKSLTYPITKFDTSVMNTNKLIYPRILFIFQYTNLDNTNEIYYHIYKPELNYKIDYIRPVNRILSSEVIRIPNNQLVRLDDQFKKKLDCLPNHTLQDASEFLQIINEDIMNASFKGKKIQY